MAKTARKQKFGSTAPLILALAAAFLTSCATLEPEPCTSEWIEYRKDRVLDAFARDNRSTLRLLKGLQDDLEDPGPLTALKIANAVGDVGDMADEFANVVVPEIQSAIDQCGRDRVQAMQLMTTFLEDQGVGDDVLAWVWTLGAVGVLLES